MTQIRFGITDDKLAEGRAKKAARILKKKYDDIEINMVPIREDAMIEALEQEQIDLVALDGTSIYGDERFSSILNRNGTGSDKYISNRNQIEVAGFLKRGDPRYILLTDKHRGVRKKLVDTEAKVSVLVDSETRKMQLNRLFDDVICINAPINAENLIEQIKSNQYDAILGLADELKLLHLQHEKDISYDYIECGQLVPDAGRAMISLLAKKGTDADQIAKNIASIKSEKEFSIECEIRKNIDMEHVIPIRYLCVSAFIDRSKLDIYVDLGLKTRSFRLKEHGEYEQKSILIRKIIEKIENIVDY